MIVYQLYLNNEAGYILDMATIPAVLEELKELNSGDILKIKAIDMSKEKFNSLPEFKGW